ncbi:hypothetical protein GCM10012275_19560 [Longimycelium tulufanense]|uniref:Aminotransferase n=1 Tax=Longimycelium tulufanense TaxID=907463 RepID=A0A8J3CCR9_9PSEU|nr:aminotransferase class I/II-fold pyridoxal phosphate-dependent enzyme [Longimycelium tulufanense]GGM48714.1 hypothetical protein GCM10012275_19560 [Longimycelium tulufanense]
MSMAATTSADLGFPTHPDAYGATWEPRSHHPGVLNLKSCELRHPAADRLVAEASRGLTVEAVRSYPVQQELVAALAEREGLDPASVLVTAGSDTAVSLLIDAFGVPAGRLVLPEPTYEAWRHYARLRGLPVMSCQHLVRSPWRIDTGALRTALRTAPPSLVAVTNPASPSGLTLSTEDVAALAVLADQHGHLLVVDECYGAFADINHVPLLARFPRLVVLRSYSKAFAVAGSRIAALYARPPVVDYLSRFRPDSTVSGCAVQLLLRLVTREAEFAAIWRDVRGIRQRFVTAVQHAHPTWRSLDPGANFATFDTGIPGLPARLADAVYRRGYRIRSLDALHGLEGCVRIALADASTMDRVADLLAQVADDDR